MVSIVGTPRMRQTMSVNIEHPGFLHDEIKDFTIDPSGEFVVFATSRMFWVYSLKTQAFQRPYYRYAQSRWQSRLKQLPPGRIHFVPPYLYVSDGTRYRYETE